MEGETCPLFLMRKMRSKGDKSENRKKEYADRVANLETSYNRLVSLLFIIVYGL